MRSSYSNDRYKSDELARKGRIFLIGDVDEEKTERVLRSLEVAKIAGIRPIILYINSPGGDLFCSLAIYDAIRGNGVSTVCYGFCGSGAAVILQGGVVRLMGEKSWLMIHEPRTSVVEEGITGLEAEASLLRRWTDTVLEIFCERGRISREDLIAAFDGRRELWLNSNDALKMGLIDGVLKDSSVSLPRRKK